MFSNVLSLSIYYARSLFTTYLSTIHYTTIINHTPNITIHLCPPLPTFIIHSNPDLDLIDLPFFFLPEEARESVRGSYFFPLLFFDLSSIPPSTLTSTHQFFYLTNTIRSRLFWNISATFFPATPCSFSLLFFLSLVGPSIYITSRYTQYINTSIHHTFPHPPHSVVPLHRLRHLLFIQLGSSSTHPLYLLAFLFSSTLSSLASLSCYMMQIHYESSSAKSKSHSLNSIS